jgi:hypothetical protein
MTPASASKAASLFDAFAHFAHFANHDDLINLLVVKSVEGDSQKLDVFKDVGDQAKFHGGVSGLASDSFSCRRSASRISPRSMTTISMLLSMIMASFVFRGIAIMLVSPLEFVERADYSTPS